MKNLISSPTHATWFVYKRQNAMSNKALFIPELSDSEDLFSSESETSEAEEDDYDIEVDWYGLRPKGTKRLWIGIYFILEGHI